MLLAGEDMDDFRSRLRGGNESFKMGHVRGHGTRVYATLCSSMRRYTILPPTEAM
jgi:hypothetical protein